MHGDAHRAGVWRRPRHRGEADCQPHPETVDELLDCCDEPLPLVIRLGADEEQKGNTARIGHFVQGDLRDVDRGEVVDDIGHPRPPGPVVEHLVDIEGRDEPVVADGEQVLRCQADAGPGIDKAGECIDEHRPISRRRLTVDGVELLWRSHRGASLWTTYLFCPRQRSSAPMPSVRSLPAKKEPASPRALRTLAQTDITAYAPTIPTVFPSASTSCLLRISVNQGCASSTNQLHARRHTSPCHLARGDGNASRTHTATAPHTATWRSASPHCLDSITVEVTASFDRKATSTIDCQTPTARSDHMRAVAPTTAAAATTRLRMIKNRPCVRVPQMPKRLPRPS